MFVLEKYTILKIKKIIIINFILLQSEEDLSDNNYNKYHLLLEQNEKNRINLIINNSLGK